MSTKPINRSVRFATSPEAVFDAFTDPEHIQAWFAQTATVNAVEGIDQMIDMLRAWLENGQRVDWENLPTE